MIDLTSPNCDLRQDAGYEPLKQFIIQATGLVYYADKDEDFSYRISKRLAETGQPDCSGYLALLQELDRGDAELDRIVEGLTVGETSFFRHSELFEALKQLIFPELLRRNSGCRRLRIWSAGCSIGAEPYSLAMLLLREFSSEVHDWDISILGTDINRRFLAQANAGIYRSWDFRGMDPWWIEDGFDQHRAEWIIKPEYRRWVTFQYHNLVRNPFPSSRSNPPGFDLVLCRNVLMYFGSDWMRDLIGQFYDSLAIGGWFLVGHAEPSIVLFRSFKTVNYPGAVLYQKNIAVQSPDEVQPSMTRELSNLNWKPSAPRTPPVPTSTMEPTNITVTPAPNADTESASPDFDCLADIRQIADRGNLDLALLECQRQLAREPMNSVLHLQHAILAEQLGQTEQVEGSLRRCIYLDPQQALAHYFNALLEQRRGRRREAIQAYDRVLEMLASRSDDAAVPPADGLTVRALRELSGMHREALCEL